MCKTKFLGIKKILLLIFSIFIISCSNNNSTSNIEPCKNNPCKTSEIPHKTVCKTISNNDYTCICEDGYTENNSLCEKIINSVCMPNPCQEEHRKNCVIEDDSYRCDCDEGYLFSNEENKCVRDYNLCDNFECGLNEECKVLNNEAICNCLSGFIKVGDNCIKNNKEKFKIRIMASNLTSGQYQDYEGPEIRIISAMKPDIVMMQEFNYDIDFNNSTSDTEVKQLITEIFGVNSGYEYYRGKEITIEEGDIPISNGIISKYPILERGEWGDSKVANRNFNYVKIDIPGDKNLWVVSLHLKAGSSYSGTRSAETESLMQKIKFNIPKDDYIIIGGDLNTTNRNENCINNLSELFKISSPHPTCEAGKEGTNTSRRNPYDWVIASKNLAEFQVSSDFCYGNDTENCKKYENGLVFDSKKYDEYDLNVYFSPVEINDSRADSMQHMGVIKDFEIEY